MQDKLPTFGVSASPMWRILAKLCSVSVNISQSRGLRAGENRISAATTVVSPISLVGNALMLRSGELDGPGVASPEVDPWFP